MNQEKIGKFISKLRKEKNLTQEELAEKLGVSSKSISRWENGKCMPDLSLLIPISKEFGITVNELISGEFIDKKDYQEKLEHNFINTIITLKREIYNKSKIIITTIILLCLSILLGIISFLLINEYKQKPIYLKYQQVDFKICEFDDDYYKVTLKTNYDDLGIHVNLTKNYNDKSLVITAYRTREENKNITLLKNYGYSNQLLEKSIEKIYYDSKLIWNNSIKVSKCK